MTTEKIAEAIEQAFESPNELDSNMEIANVVDGLFAIARAIAYLADKIDVLCRLPDPEALMRTLYERHPNPDIESLLRNPPVA